LALRVELRALVEQHADAAHVGISVVVVVSAISAAFIGILAVAIRGPAPTPNERSPADAVLDALPQVRTAGVWVPTVG
jgi:hypothetical protein